MNSRFLLVLSFFQITLAYIYSPIPHQHVLITTKTSLGATFSTSSRRSFVNQSILAPAFGFVGVSAGLPVPSLAEVSAGTSLPDGANQFSRVLKSKAEVADVVKSLSSSSPVDADQWKTLQLYIRKLYSVGDDMLFVGKGLDKDKKAEAEKIVNKFRTDVKAADKPAREQNVGEFKELMVMADSGLSSFLDLLQDVPDEI
mmetsp:Transcript_3308/g.6733  ORF Transcript_3308/g.6733 Transcript_3308/m.6733 type:complete len:200 (+) Transcript_3308:2-601(+)